MKGDHRHPQAPPKCSQRPTRGHPTNVPWVPPPAPETPSLSPLRHPSHTHPTDTPKHPPQTPQNVPPNPGLTPHTASHTDTHGPLHGAHYPLTHTRTVRRAPDPVHTLRQPPLGGTGRTTHADGRARRDAPPAEASTTTSQKRPAPVSRGRRGHTRPPRPHCHFRPSSSYSLENQSQSFKT